MFLCGSGPYITQIALVLCHDNGKGPTVYCVLGAGADQVKYSESETAEWFTDGGFVQSAGVAAAFCGTGISPGMVYPDIQYIWRHVHYHHSGAVHQYRFLCLLPYAL